MIRIGAGTYPVLVGGGLLDRAETLLPPGRRFLVTDRNVEKAGWPQKLANLAGRHVIEPGEANKNMATLERLLNVLLDAGIERGDIVLALGGGMVGDLAGLAAALVKRGCRLVQLPTTLLAMVDASVGGKTGINTGHGKNLVGTFHDPELVIADADTLATLPPVALRGGYAEVAKYGLIGDSAFFDWCEANGRALIAGDSEARLHAIETCARAKIVAVRGDERDLSGQRALLNFGHSFGHAIETEAGIAHGLAVAIGMAMAFRLSHMRGLCPAEDVARVTAHLTEIGLPTQPSGLDPDALLARMRQDKKALGGKVRLVLTHGIGKAFVDDGMSADALAAFLAAETA
ncbi:MAG: 3-dehydroquinate synthase [Sphingomonas sp.]